MTGPAARLLSLAATLFAVMALLSLSFHRMDVSSGDITAKVAAHAMHSASTEATDSSEQAKMACTFHCLAGVSLTEAGLVTIQATRPSAILDVAHWLPGLAPLPLGPPPKVPAFA